MTFAEAPSLDAARTIPFDYAFRFNLTGIPGSAQSQRITISIEGAFTAVSVGYGVISQVQPIRFGPLPPPPGAPIPIAVPGPPKTLGDVRVSDLVTALDALAPTERDLVLKNGLRLSPDVASLAIGAPLTAAVLSQAFEAIPEPLDGIQFTYALFDDGSGREFQSEPILNTAGLGTSNGERPFRQLARPITFAPQAVIRMAITELSTVAGELHVSLHGYKVLGASSDATARRRAMRRRRR
jgi:hypothetical protein